jgi:replication factor A1
MKISDLRDGMRRVDVEADVVRVDEPRHVNLKSGGEARTADITIRDGSGQVVLSLWDEQIDRIMVGQRIRITNGYTNSFRGEMKLQTGKYAKFEVLENQPLQQKPVSAGVAQPKQEPMGKPVPAKGNKLDAYYGSVDDLQETDLPGAKQLLKQGWTLEKIDMKHVTTDTPSGLSHESAWVYVLSHRKD